MISGIKNKRLADKLMLANTSSKLVYQLKLWCRKSLVKHEYTPAYKHDPPLPSMLSHTGFCGVSLVFFFSGGGGGRVEF